MFEKRKDVKAAEGEFDKIFREKFDQANADEKRAKRRKFKTRFMSAVRRGWRESAKCDRENIFDPLGVPATIDPKHIGYRWGNILGAIEVCAKDPEAVEKHFRKYVSEVTSFRREVEGNIDAESIIRRAQQIERSHELNTSQIRFFNKICTILRS